MASYQDIDVRLKTLENMLLFVMTSTRMRGMISSGLLDQAGNPTGKIIEGTLLDFFRMSQAEGLLTESAPNPEVALEEQKEAVS